MWKTLCQIGRTGIITEPPPLIDDSLRVAGALQSRILEVLGRALCIRAIDAGSCNGCELEIHALNNPLYNIEGQGIRFVASPRHADLLLITGPVAKNMEVALRRTYDAAPDPKLVVAVGDCGGTGGIFGERYASCGRVSAESSSDPQWYLDGDLQGSTGSLEFSRLRVIRSPYSLKSMPIRVACS